MRKSLGISAVVVLFFPFISISSFEQPSPPGAAVKPPNATAQVLAQRNLPLEFIPNAGQTDSRVKFYIKGSDRTLYFSPEGVTLALFEETKAAKSERKEVLSGLKERKSGPRESWVVKMDFVGARKDIAPEGLDKTGAAFSYFKGSREDWHTGLPGYRRIIYRNLWPGIDLVYKGDVGRLKYEFIVGPGVDPGLIRLNIQGANGVTVDKDSRLVVDTPLEKIIDDKPLVYQDNKIGRQKPVEAAYKLEKAKAGSTQVEFSLADYDRSLPLVIDPATLVYCGFIGGSGSEEGYGIAVDGSGSAYIMGDTGSTETTFPVGVGPDLTLNGNYDVFVAKVNASGTGLDYCGFIGGSGSEGGNGIAVDGSGSAYITGDTNSTETTFPVWVGPDLTFNGYRDAFVAKVNASGTGLDYCGYIGGSNWDEAIAIAVNGSGSAYITGYTNNDETTFPVGVGPDLTFNGYYDAFVAKVNASGTGLDYCGFIGGSNFDIGCSIAVDGSGSAYITGYTNNDETTFPVGVGPDLTFNGYIDAFVAKVNASGTGLVYCGYIGGSGAETGRGIALDGSGSAYITGETYSDETTFPVGVGPDLTFKGYYDAFVARVNASGTGLDFCGYIGGSNYDVSYGIALDGSGSAYITGETYSDETTFPVGVGPDLIHNGGDDAFVAKIAYAPEFVEMFADISLSKAVDNLKPYVDENVIFTVTAANLGPDNATGVVVKDLLPVGLSFVSASASQGTYDPATGLWTVGALNDDGTSTLTLRAKVDKEGTITNTATSAGLNEIDRNALNNTASVSLTAEYRVYAPSSFLLQRLESDLIFSTEHVNRLTWAANPLNKSLIVSYRLYRKAKAQPDTAFALYKEFASSVTSFDDRGLKMDDLFTYRLTSVNIAGKESEPVEAGN